MGDFVEGRESDSDEKDKGERHIRPEDTRVSYNAPAGDWVDVHRGMVAAPDSYVDDSGVLRSTTDHSCVVWHLKGCKKKGIQPDQIIYDSNGAPWCPKCYVNPKDTGRKKRKPVRAKGQKIKDYLGGRVN